MSYTYAHKKPSRTRDSVKGNMQALDSGMPNAALSGLYGDAMSSLAAESRPTDIPGALRSRMEESFGTDFSAVKFYENDSLADAGAGAVAQGTNIVFAPGVLDFSTRSGQEVLGHELSHVVSRARGEVGGSGFLDNASLEARADMEGRMAAAGETVYSGAVTGALSPISASSAGPVQAWKLPWKRNKEAPAAAPAQEAAPAPEAAPEPVPAPAPAPRDPYSSQLPDQLSDEWEALDPAQAGNVDRDFNVGTAYASSVNGSRSRNNKEGLVREMAARYGDNSGQYMPGGYSGELRNATSVMTRGGARHGENGAFRVKGLVMGRVSNALEGSLGEDMTREEILDMTDKLMAAHRIGLSEDEVADADAQFNVGINQLKNVYLRHLRKMEKTYGAAGQIHPDDLIRMADNRFYSNMHILQDTEQLKLAFDMDHSENEEDQEFARLSDYYNNVSMQMTDYGIGRMMEDANKYKLNSQDWNDHWQPKIQNMTNRDTDMRNVEAAMGGPRMDKKKYKAYMSGLKKRFKKEKGRLYGRFAG